MNSIFTVEELRGGLRSRWPEWATISVFRPWSRLPSPTMSRERMRLRHGNSCEAFRSQPRLSCY